MTDQLTKEQLDAFFTSQSPPIQRLRDILEYAQNAGIRARLEGSADANVGTAAAGVTAAEFGNAYFHRTVLTVATTLPAIAGGANLAVGNLLYTLPAGAVVVNCAQMSLAITQSEGNITADTPDGGLGTTIASGAVAVLGGTAAFENILTGQAFGDCDGAVELITVAPGFVIEAAAAHTVHFNVADGWAASGDAGAALAGQVVLDWSLIG